MLSLVLLEAISHSGTSSVYLQMLLRIRLASRLHMLILGCDVHWGRWALGNVSRQDILPKFRPHPLIAK